MSYMSLRSSTRSMIWRSISSSRTSDMPPLSPLTGANFTSVASNMAFLRCCSRQECTVLVKSCPMAICMTPTWLSLSSFSSSARLSRCSSSWLSARLRSRVTWHSCSLLLIMRCSFCSFVCTRRHSSRTRESLLVSSALAWCNSAFPASSVLWRFIKFSMSPSKSSSHSCTTTSRKRLYWDVRSIFFCSVLFRTSCSSRSRSRDRISVSKRRHSACSSFDFFSPFSMFVSSSSRDFSFSRTCCLSAACFFTKRASFSLHAPRRMSTLDRVASNSLLASLSSLSFLRSCVDWFSSCSAARIPRSFAILPSSTFFHSSLTSLRQCFSMKFAEAFLDFVFSSFPSRLCWAASAR
mmetsp:Transcript_49611/g.106228  ORF Transcript_49611/g.106228 Transcript_49611/m.106228 type:complete len:351 (-) Transcript_49611:133-1185(-)